LVGFKLWSEKIFAPLESPNVPFAETISFEISPEDFQWDCWSVEYRFRHLFTPK
jgi:hypothetical protein